MNKSPESKHNQPSLAEAYSHLLGALFRPSLIKAMIEAKDREKPLPQKERLETYLAYLDYRTHWPEARKAFLDVLDRKKGAHGKAVLRIMLLNEDRVKTLIYQEIVAPLAQIYTEIEGQIPQTDKPWLGELMIRAAKKPEATADVYILLSRFGLNPKALLHEIDDSLDSDLGKG